MLSMTLHKKRNDRSLGTTELWSSFERVMDTHGVLCARAIFVSSRCDRGRRARKQGDRSGDDRRLGSEDEKLVRFGSQRFFEMHTPLP